MDVHGRDVLCAVGLEFCLIAADQLHYAVDSFVDSRVHIVGARFDLDVEMDKIHQDRARLLQFLRVESHGDVDDLIGDPLDAGELFPSVISDRVGDLDVLPDNVDRVAFVRELIRFWHSFPFVKYVTLTRITRAAKRIFSGSDKIRIMTEQKTPGLLLQAIPYLGRQRILKVFTPENGLVSLFAKASISSAFSAPFCIAEWVYKKGTKEIHSLKDASLIDSLLELKKDYTTLSAAGSIAQDLLRSQLPGKKGTGLYELALACFKKLPAFSKPEILAASFRIKLLLHEGLLSLQNECARCGHPAFHLHQGESYCLSHALFPGHTFSLNEWESLQVLAYSRQFSQLQSLLTAPLSQIEQLFRERISH